MHGKAKIKSISYGITGGYSVTMDITNTTLDEIKLLEPEELSIELKKWRNRRSLDANAYFHVLVAKIAEVIKISNAEVKNLMIERYGYPLINSNGKITYLTGQTPPEDMKLMEFIHTALVDVRVNKKDKTFYTYKVMRGSHTYDTKEMSRLIDGTVQEAKDLGIETLPPDELERMKSLWKANA